jgi:hypothetical protein
MAGKGYSPFPLSPCPNIPYSPFPLTLFSSFRLSAFSTLYLAWDGEWDWKESKWAVDAADVNGEWDWRVQWMQRAGMGRNGQAPMS